MKNLPFELKPLEAKEKLATGEAALIDVREIAEYQLAHIEGSELIPMSTVPQQLQYLEGIAENKLLIVLCHHGMRSLSVVSWLRKQGLENCVSMAGGIDLWTSTVDPAVPKY